MYAYSEGIRTELARDMKFTGAPVLYIPGNKGSYKQVRSLASVALRKGIDSNWMTHLDYFTVDLDEKYSGVFGGVLDEQTNFVATAIAQILKLYRNLPNPPKDVVIIGHSMGGKIAQAVLTLTNSTDMINTIITLAAPMDRPVIALDFHMDAFYRKVDKYWLANRKSINEITNDTNTCCNQNQKDEKVIKSKDLLLDNKLLVTIGGGSRDVMVHSGLTNSKFSDIHAMTTSMPNVWLTADHQCAVWCLQLVLNVNRFLFSILEPMKSTRDLNQKFIEDKSVRLEKANFYFKNEKLVKKSNEILMDELGNWVEDSRRVFTEKFKDGLTKTRVQMIRLINTAQHKILDVEAVNLETDDWIFGCAANDVKDQMRYCAKATSITHLANKLPSLRHERYTASLDLHQLKKEHPEWTHVLIRALPSKEPLQLNVDVHSSSDRDIHFTMPKWYTFSKVKLLEETTIGSTVYNILINGMTDTYQTIELNVEPKSCSYKTHHSVGKVCVPWTDGFDRYHYFTETKKEKLYVYIPHLKPSGYNTTDNPVKVKLNLDPSCRYTITAQNSLTQTMARIVHQYSHWLPAHLVAIILLSFKHQISLTPHNEPFKVGKLHSALLKCSPFFIITASKVFVKMILWTKQLPIPDPYELPMLLSILIHGTAFALISFAIAGSWAGICFSGNMAHKILFRMLRLPIPTIAGFLVPVIEKFPISVGICLISLATASCGGIALICACFVYFILLSKMYEEYLEEYVYDTAKLIAKKLFGFSRKEQAEEKEKLETEEKKKKEEDEGETDETDEEIEVEKEKVDESNENILNENKTNMEISKVENVEGSAKEEDEDDDDEATEKKLDALLKETAGKKNAMQSMKDKELLAARVEYDAIHEGLSGLNFHLPLFFLLVILTLLNLPSVITWANNFR